MSVMFSGSTARKERADEELRSRLYQEIGQLKVEVDWLKKVPHLLNEKRSLVDIGHPHISLERQMRPLGSCALQ